MSSPRVGDFIRPVGRNHYAYCYLITDAIVDEEGITRLVCTRWGCIDGAPYDDGHLAPRHSISCLVQVRPGVWRQEWCSWGGQPRYWLRVQKLAGVGHQLDIFAELAA